MKNNILLTLIITALFSCKMEQKQTTGKIESIVCTTGMLGDAVRNVVSSDVKVITLMGPGVDPHLYKATQGDLKALTDADVIVYNGLHLEGKMGDIFEKLEDRKIIIAASDGINKEELINNSEFKGAQDPHIWFDVKLWSTAVKHISTELAKQVTDSVANEIKANAKKYTDQLLELDKAVFSNLNALDSNKKVLITAHDAFSYFGRAYNFQVKGLQGISTTSEYGLKDVSDMVNFIVNRKIKAVFVESSVSKKSIEAVVEGCIAKDHNVLIGGYLFSDAMGEYGTPEGTYIGMVKHNVKMIVTGLK